MIPIPIAIVDDKKPNRNSLKEKITFNNELEVLFMAGNGKEFLDAMKLHKNLLPKVVLMDIDMPLMNGIEAVRIAHTLYPETRFLMLTVFDDDDKIFDAIKAGAVGYLLKDESVEVISEAVKQLVEIGGAPMSPSIARKALNLLMNAKLETKSEPTASYNISEREMDILKLMVEGLDYKQVAEKLFISPHTVRTHISNIYEKLHVCNKTQAINIAIKNKWF